MKPKKYDHVSLEHNRGLFLKIGFLFALSLSLLLFEWQTPVSGSRELMTQMGIDVEVEMIPQTRMKDLKPPKPKIQTTTILQVEDEEELTEELLPDDYETSSNEAIYIVNLEDEDVLPPTTIVDYAQVMPQFPGGNSGLLKFISNNIRYPAMARENNIQGKVFIKFIVDNNGYVEQAHVIRSVDKLLDKEALRVVRSLPRWCPGYNMGKPVKVWYTIPITFKLN